MPTIDEEIGRSLQQSLQSGELKSAKSWGKPLAEDTAFSNTPDEFRMPFKILKDAGFVPPEVAVFNEIAKLRSELVALAPLSDERKALEKRIAELRLKVTIRLEAMRATASYSTRLKHCGQERVLMKAYKSGGVPILRNVRWR